MASEDPGYCDKNMSADTGYRRCLAGLSAPLPAGRVTSLWHLLGLLYRPGKLSWTQKCPLYLSVVGVKAGWCYFGGLAVAGMITQNCLRNCLIQKLHG